jgi:type IV pilus assembly protein PilB
LDLGIESFLVSATVEAIIAQRLVRTICRECKVTYEPGEDVLIELGLSAQDLKGKRFAYGQGCDACHASGYKGRTAIFEILRVSEAVRQMVIKGASSDAIRDQGRREGMRTLRESGLLAIFDGVTTVEEVLRETMG